MIESPSTRVRFTEDEKRFPWLSLLLDAYAVVDSGVDAAIDTAQTEQGKRLACHRGCDNCCRTHQDIPIYPLELVAIYWFTTERMEPSQREPLKQRLAAHSKGSPCPFLMEGGCSIHVVRPVACRQFNVLGEPCSEGEDAYHTRRQDVLVPTRDYTNKAFSIMLPFYGITGEAEKARAIEAGLIHSQASNLQEFDWRKLLRTMEKFDTSQETGPGKKN